MQIPYKCTQRAKMSCFKTIHKITGKCEKLNMQFSDAESHLRPNCSQHLTQSQTSANRPETNQPTHPTAVQLNRLPFSVHACRRWDELGNRGEKGWLSRLFTYMVRFFPLSLKQLTSKCIHKQHHSLFKKQPAK